MQETDQDQDRGQNPAKLDPENTWTGHDLGTASPQGYELFWGSGGHSGPYWGMEEVKQWVWAHWAVGKETHIHVHRRDKAGLGGYWYLGSYRLQINGEKIWPKPLAEWHIGRDRVWNRQKSNNNRSMIHDDIC